MIQSQSSIIQAIDQICADVFDTFNAMDQQTYMYAPPHKWTCGQHVEHLIMAMRPVTNALSLPKIALKLKFGKANRPSRTYEYVYNKYITGIKNGYKAPDIVLPSAQPYAEKDALLKSFQKIGLKLSKATSHWSEKQLDDYILPHPAMGRMPIREILFFTEFHTAHHLNIIKSNYINKKI